MKISQKSPKNRRLQRAFWGGTPDPLDWGDPPREHPRRPRGPVDTPGFRVKRLREIPHGWILGRCGPPSLKDSNDIEYFDQIVALCGAAQRRHVQPTRRARVASARFRAIRLSCKRSAAAAAKSPTRSRTADRFLLLSLIVFSFKRAFEASYTSYPSCTLLFYSFSFFGPGIFYFFLANVKSTRPAAAISD